MTVRARSLVLLRAAAVVVLPAGCSDSGGEDSGHAAKKAAATYQEAVLDQDWPKACRLKTQEMRGSSVTECVDLLETGSGGSDGTKTGQVATETPVVITASGDHPAGVGVLVSYKVTHETGASDTARKVLRMVETDGTWRVEQTATLNDSDGTGAEAIRTVLRER